MGDLNPHAQCLKLSNGGKKRGQDKTLVVSLFYRMDCSFPAGDFMMQLLVRQAIPTIALPKAGFLGPGFCGPAFWCLGCVQAKQKVLPRQAHRALVTSM